MKEKIRVDAVVFDYGNVISFPQRPSDAATMADICDIPIESFHELYWKFRYDYDRGWDGKTYWNRIFHEANRTATSEQIATLISVDTESWSRINEGALRWVEYLHSLGFRMGVLSNMPRELARSLEKRQWAQCFSSLIFSCDCGSVKPEDAVYRQCLSSLNVAAEKVLFLDDRQENVDAAANLGIYALLFDGAENVSAQVEELFDLRPPSGI
jgi:putative hydrolase of the HAD superfamily